MGKLFKDRDWTEDYPTEQYMREVMRLYFENVNDLNTNKNMTAGVRARKYLLELFHLCRKRRKEILEQKREYKYRVHPSWEGVKESPEREDYADNNE
jgi:hypothetical protein